MCFAFHIQIYNPSEIGCCVWCETGITFYWFFFYMNSPLISIHIEKTILSGKDYFLPTVLQCHFVKKKLKMTVYACKNINVCIYWFSILLHWSVFWLSSFQNHIALITIDFKCLAICWCNFPSFVFLLFLSWLFSTFFSFSHEF